MPNPNPQASLVPANVDLHKLVGQLATGLLPFAVQKKSFILNDVNPELLVVTDENLLAFVLGNLLNNAVVNTDNDCIHVTASLSGEYTFIHVKDYNGTAGRPADFGWETVQPVAEKLGGSVSFTQNKSKGTSIAFSFYNKLKCA